jgi:hypothetical protein
LNTRSSCGSTTLPGRSTRVAAALTAVVSGPGGFWLLDLEARSSFVSYFYAVAGGSPELQALLLDASTRSCCLMSTLHEHGLDRLASVRSACMLPDSEISDLARRRE